MRRFVIWAGCILIVVLLIACAAILLPGCGKKSTSPTEPDPLAGITGLTGAEQKLGFRLFPAMGRDYYEDTYICSPLNFMWAMTVLALGGDDNFGLLIQGALIGDTLNADSFYQGMCGLRDMVTGDANPSVAQFHDKLFNCTGTGMKEEFLTLCSLKLGIDPVRLDCNTAQADTAFRDWMVGTGHGFFSDSIRELGPYSVFLLQQKLFVGDDWSIPFDRASVRPDSFTLLGGQRVACSLMTVSGQFAVYVDSTLSAVHLPLRDTSFIATIMLPAPGITANDLIERLTIVKWQTILPKFTIQQVTTTVPKMGRHRYFLYETHAAIRLGLQRLFSSSLPLKRMYDYLVEMNDLTTWGCLSLLPDSLQTLQMKPTAPALDSQVEIECNRPFLILIWHRPTGMMLNMAKIARPI